MDIIKGKAYENLTARLLLPCLESFDSTFQRYFSRVFKLAVGVHDMQVDGSPEISGRNIFVLFDLDFNTEIFIQFLEWCKDKDFFVGEYTFADRQHMMVINVPEEHNDAYDCFLKGQYSKMYSEDFLETNFMDKHRLTEHNILTKNELFLPNLGRQLRLQFGDDPKGFTDEHLKGNEIELPLKREEEVFNCKDTEKPNFNEELTKVWFY